MSENYSPFEQAVLRHQRLQTAGVALILVLLIVLGAVLGPRALRATRNVSEAMEKVTELSEDIKTLTRDAETSLARLNGLALEASGSLAGIDEMVSGVSELVETNTQSVTNAIAGIEKVDFEKLNQAIADLAAVVEPLANFFGLFNGNR